MNSLVQFEAFIRQKIEGEKWSHREISEYLATSHPGHRGFSVRSIQRFCAEFDIHKTSRIGDTELKNAVSKAVEMVCWL